MENEDETYALTEKGVQTVIYIDYLRKNTNLTDAEIAETLADVDDELSLQILVAIGEYIGLIEPTHGE